MPSDSTEPTRLAGPVARDFNVSVIPDRPDPSFGPGFYTGTFVCFGLVIVTFVAAFLADDDITQIRRLGYVLVAFGITFLFAIVYTVVTHKGIPWSFAFGSRYQAGTLDRNRNPAAFWTFVIFMTILFCALCAAGAYLSSHCQSFGHGLSQPRTAQPQHR